MREKFDSLSYQFKDRHIRKKLNESDFTLRKISKNISVSQKERVDILFEWLSNERGR